MKAIEKKATQKKASGTTLRDKFHPTFRIQDISIKYSLFQKRILPNSSYEVSITLLSKQDKDYMKKEKNVITKR